MGGGTGGTNLANGADRFVAMMSGNVNASESVVQLDVPVASTFSNLYVRLNASPGASKTYTFVVRKNGVDTALTCAISGAATACSDTVNTVTFVVGDLISIRATPTSSPTARSMQWSAVRSP